MKKAPIKAPEVLVPVPCYDRNRYTCIELLRDESFVKFIPLDVNDGLSVKKVRIPEFDGRFKPIINYSVEKAISHFWRIAGLAGITEEARGYLSRILPTEVRQEMKMPNTKKAPEVKPKPGKGKPAPVPEKSKKPAVKAATKSMTAAARFQELIMEGKLTDEKIFQKVQGEFDLDDSKKGYVAWYRNYLRKKGSNPPEPKQ